LPLTPNTVTVTSLPIITVSPTRLVNINIFVLLIFLGNYSGTLTAWDRIAGALVHANAGSNRHENYD
jgi:hypothetical protein